MKMVKELSYWINKNEKHWMTDSMSLPKKQVSFFQRAMKIEVSENMVTPNILLKRQ